MKHDSEILKQIKSYFMRRKSADEAHAFEREAERDAFLYEAMEGIEGMLTSELQQSMDELDDRLDEKSKRIILPAYFGIAASVFALIAVSTGLYFSVFRTADTEKEVVTDDHGESNYLPREKTGSFDSLGSISLAEDTVKTDVKAEEISVDVANEIAAIPSNTEVPTEKEMISEIASTSDDDESMDTSLDSSADDTAMEERELAEGIVEPEISRQQEPVTLSQRAKSAPAEVKDSAQDNELESSTSAPTATPAMGWASYNSYLKKNLNASETMPKGTVVLSFELDRNGKPKKIEVIKSLCTACDAEASRLVENGPVWTSDDKKTKGSVNVTFP